MASNNNPEGMLPDSTVMKLLRMAADTKEQNSAVKEVEAEYRKALNGIAKSKNGQFVLKYLLIASRIYSVEYGSDIVRMADARGRRNYFVEMIWQYLTPQSKQEIE